MIVVFVQRLSDIRDVELQLLKKYGVKETH